ncbi:MAG TPA: hypothetical protein PLM79_17940 [Syntrophobacteraceae bacterium]|nr:hypothetical protein [Syntrophobacteraceae bacterium]
MNRDEIRKWMIDEGVTQAQIAREARVSKALVSLVIKGERQNDLVVTLLRGHGCPEEYLAAPRKQKRRKAA